MRYTAEMSDRANRRPDRKTMQLCKQVQRALSFALPETGNELLLDAYVEEVQPGPDASRLLVSVRGHGDPLALITALNEHVGQLRSSVAEAITRRKAPELAFQVV